MNTFFIADTHFGHKNALKFRPQFKTIEEHDQCIIDNWNSVVRPKDLVWVLGDFSFLCEPYRLREVVQQLNGVIKLVVGNHDDWVRDPDCWDGFEKVEIMLSLINKYKFTLSHAPIHESALRDKVNIHGHLHDKKVERWSRTKDDGGISEIVDAYLKPDDRYICVSCEQINYTPISLEEIRGKVR